MSELLNEYMALPYTIRAELVTEDSGDVYWFAQVVEIDGCMATGKTEVEATNRVWKVLRECISTMLKFGDDPPRPKSKPRPSVEAFNIVVQVDEAVLRIISNEDDPHVTTPRLESKPKLPWDADENEPIRLSNKSQRPGQFITG